MGKLGYFLGGVVVGAVGIIAAACMADSFSGHNWAASSSGKLDAEKSPETDAGAAASATTGQNAENHDAKCDTDQPCPA